MQETLQQSSISLARSDELGAGLQTRGMLDESDLELGPPRGEVDFDQLDKEREAMDFEGLDDFLKGVEDNMKDTGADLGRIKSLEKNLEDEKRRLASMELQLRDAKKQRESENQMVVVQKQTKVLANMFQTLTKATRSEVDQRHQWEEEWRAKFDDFHRQHREMEEALKRKHVSELKSLQDDIQKSIKRVALDVQRTRGQAAPSPRTMGKMSEHSMERLVALYHKHGQERLFLASKIAKQEEVLVRSKNQSLQRFMVDSQSNCNRLYKKFNLPTSKSIMKQVEMGQDPSFDSASLPPQTAAKRKQRTADSRRLTQTRAGAEAPRSRGVSTSWAASTGPLPSPRINDGSMTFLTEIGMDGEETYNPPQGRHDGGAGYGTLQPATAPSGSMAAMARGKQEPLSSTLPAGSAQMPLGSQPLAATYAAGSSTAGSQQLLRADALSAEFSGWGKAAPPPQEGRPRWDSQTLTAPGLGGSGSVVPPPQWHPNIIAFEPTAAGGAKKGTASPYLGMTGGVGGMPRKGKGAGRATKTKGLGTKKGPTSMSGASNARSVSTEPRIEQSVTSPFGTSGRTGAAGGGHGTTTLPHIGERKGGRVQATDLNLSRPFTELATHDDLPSKEQKLHKLESWIEDKIRSVLGDDGTRANILSSKLASAAIRADSPEKQPFDNRGRTPSATASSAAGMYASGAGWERVSSNESRGTVDQGHPTPVSSLMGKLQASMSGAEQPSDDGGEDGEPGEGNAGFVVQDADERVRRRRREEESRRGKEVDQLSEGTVIPSGGKTARDGTHVELAESEEAAERRKALERVSSRKSGKRVGWDLSDGDTLGYTTGGDTTDGEGLGSTLGSTMPGASSRPATDGSMVSGFLSRPETSASSYLGETEPEDEGEGEGGAKPSRRARQREAGEEPQAATGEALKDLMSKVRHNKVPEVEELLARGFPIDQRDAHGNTALMVAAQNGHKRLVKMTLRYGADPNASNHQGNTALHFATSYGYTALSKYLISKGGDDTLINLKGLTCYDGIG